MDWRSRSASMASGNSSMAALFNIKSFQIVPDCSLTSIKQEFESKFIELQLSYEDMVVKHRDPLAQACRAGNIERLELDLKKTNVDLVKGLARLAEIAAERGHVKVVMYLVDKTRNAIVNLSEHQNDAMMLDLGNALHAAAYSGHVDVVNYLVEHKYVNPDAYDKQSNSGLHIAASRGHLAVVEALCRVSKRPLGYLNRAGFSPLHLAVIYNKSDVVDYLLQDGDCNPTQKTLRGSTVLHIACEKNNERMLNFLVTQTALVEKLLLEDEEGYRPIHIAAMKGCIKLVEFLADKMVTSGHYPNGKGSSGWTPLHCAAEVGNLQLVQFFCCQEGFEPKGSIGPGNLSPLHLAALGGKKQVMEFLLKRGLYPAASVCSVFVLSNALHLAAFHGHINCCQVLIDDYNLDPLTPAGSGNTAIHLAAGAGNVTTLKYLVETKNHTPNVTTRFVNATPLHVAAGSGQVPAIKWLLSHPKCNPNIQMSLNRVAPLHLVVMEGNLEAVRLLAAHPKCDVNLKAMLGMTPLSLSSDGKVCWELIKNGSSPFPKLAQLSSDFRFLETWIPVLPTVRLYVVGHSGAGKTSLVQALQKEGKWLPRAITNVEPHTAGIIPVDFESLNFGRVTVYDFAGDREYYASHEALLAKSDTAHPIFLLVVKLSLPDDEVQESIRYWRAFIKNATATKSTDKVPQVIIVGSHIDKLSSTQLREKMQQVLSPLVDDDVNFVTMNCCKPTSAGMTQLRKSLNQLCAPLRSLLRVHRHAHALASFLDFTQRSKPCIACQLRQIRKDMEQYGAPITDFLHELPELVQSLSDAGHLLLLREDKGEEDDSWVVFDQKAILEKVHGYQDLFEDRLGVEKSKCSGILNLNQIKRLFDVPGLNIYALVNYLVHMEFCYKIKDAKVLQALLQSRDNSTNTLGRLETHHFLFPDLLLDDPMGDAMFPPEGQECCVFGWCLRSRGTDCYITSRFVQLFLPRLGFELSLNTPIVARDTYVELQQQTTCLWKRGVSWSSNNVNCTVELAEDDRSIVVTCHCKKGFEMELVQQRTQILNKVHAATRQYFNKSFKMEEFVISPDSVLTALHRRRRRKEAVVAGQPSSVDSLAPFFHNQMKVCSVVDVHRTLFDPKVTAVGHHCINLCRLHDREYRGMGQINVDDLLLFEPFSLVRGGHLARLSSGDSRGGEALDESWVREGIAEFSGDRWRKLAKVLGATAALVNSCSKELTPIDSCMKLYREHLQESCTYEALKEKFDRYSIFFGRSLKEIEKTGFNLKSAPLSN